LLAVSVLVQGLRRVTACVGQADANGGAHHTSLSPRVPCPRASACRAMLSASVVEPAPKKPNRHQLG
jgi:hypothetical protein